VSGEVKRVRFFWTIFLDSNTCGAYNPGVIVEARETLLNGVVKLRCEAQYWKAMHARAVEREAGYKEKIRHLEQGIRGQEAQMAERDQQIEELNAQMAERTQQIEALKARVAWLAQQVFGRKSEQTNGVACETPGEEEGTGESSPEGKKAGGKRGKRRGAKGYGRKRREHLFTEEILHDLPEEKQRCGKCGKRFVPFPGTEDSEEIDWEVRLVRRVHRRARYRRSCECPGQPGIVTAPGPAKLIPKGMFSIEFWVRLLLEKYLFQRPLYRLRQVLALEGLEVSQGTLTGGLKRILELVQPLYVRILERSRATTHWHMDETRWMVFAEIEGKVGHKWWLWVVVTAQTCVYLLEPTRSAEVPRNHLGEEAQGIISADRYVAYQALGKKIRVAFCWAHVRRDFVRIRDARKKLRAWAQEWVERINDLFRQNAKRLAVRSNPEAFATEDQALRKALDVMAQERDRQLAEATVHPVKKKVLTSLRNHWEGLLLFVEHPEIPMDNNESERRLRTPVVGRKNYYGSGSIWSGKLTAMLFTIFQTLLLNRIDPQKFLLAYFEACAQNGGQAPENPDPFLPWNLSEQQKAQWHLPDHPP
jgi:transposase